MNFLENLRKFFSLPIWDYVYVGNTIRDYALAVLAFFGFLILFKIIYVLIVNRLESFARKTRTNIDDILIEVAKSLKPPFYGFLAIFLAIRLLEVNLVLEQIITALLIIFVVYQGVLAAQIVIDRLLKERLKGENDKNTEAALDLMGTLLKIALWSVGTLLVLSNLGVNISSLIAGLGIGGIAVALALQNILGDLFSSFAIYFDKPFSVGDFIVVGDKMGVVKKIGIKTTRIKALQGEEIVISNRELTGAHIQNFKKLKERRIAFSFGVTYGTNKKQLEKIPATVKEIISRENQARFDRAHFKSFGDSALIFEVIYYIQSSDYNVYMDVQEGINLALKEALAKLKIEFAYPTQTVYISKV